MTERKNRQRPKPDQKAGKSSIEITYYTDPLCCWSWVFEPEWKKFLKEFGKYIRWQYCLGGMIPDWAHYRDPLNSVERPAQMGPVWMDAMYRTGVKVHFNLWAEDPPSSSYPACVAVKCAGLQSVKAEQTYFQKVREAVMLEGLNISKSEVLAGIARALWAKTPELLDYDLFLSDLRGERCRNAFREDLTKIRYNSINRFPTLTMCKAGQPGILLTGYRPYNVLRDAFLHLHDD